MTSNRLLRFVFALLLLLWAAVGAYQLRALPSGAGTATLLFAWVFFLVPCLLLFAGLRALGAADSRPSFFGTLLAVDTPSRKDTVSVGLGAAIASLLGLVFPMLAGVPLAGLIVGGTFLAVGVLFGFLFGIPKAVAETGTAAETAPTPGAPSSSRLPFRANTSLEQISDWLTKILVGLGLTELRTLPARLDALANYFAPTVARLPNNSAKPMALAVVLYFFVVGFISGYLLTRLRMIGALLAADTAAATMGEAGLQQVSDAALRIDATVGEPALEQQSSTTRDRMAILQSMPLTAIRTATEAMGWAAARLFDRKWQEALDGYDKARALGDASAAVHYGRALALHYLWQARSRSSQEVLAALQDATHALPPPNSVATRDLWRNVYVMLTFHQLYELPPLGFTRARDAALSYVGRTDVKPSAGVFINLACAYGQHHRYLQKLGPEAPKPPGLDVAPDTLVRLAAQALNDALKVRPDDTELARSVQNQLDGKGDDDLVTVAPAIREQNLLQPPRKP